MEIRQKTIGDIVESERLLVVNAVNNYGDFYKNAADLNEFLNRPFKSIDSADFLFAIFWSHIKKHHTLALLSAVRRHKTQSLMNLRQVLEATASAMYTLGNITKEDYKKFGDNLLKEFSKRIDENKYKWILDIFPTQAKALKYQQDQINNTFAHAYILNAHQTFNLDEEKNQFQTPFFDREDIYFEKFNLWLTANVAWGVLDLLYRFDTQIRSISLREDFLDRFRTLSEENTRVKELLMSDHRFTQLQ